MAGDDEKQATALHELAPAETQESDIIGFEADLEHLPPGYYRSRFFIGSMIATGLGLFCGVSAFGYPAPILADINRDIGPDPRYIWISLIYNCCLAIFLAIVGRLSDIFGRRYFLIGFAGISVVGCIVCATAKNIPVLIGKPCAFRKNCKALSRHYRWQRPPGNRNSLSP
jgi:hypothetical protein